jgi:hypothetical protein
VDAILAYEPPDPAAGGAYRIGCRAVARDGWPCAVVQVRWVENGGDRPLRLEQYFHYPLPAIGDGPQGDDVGGPHGVPNYYLASACWTDPRLGGWLGVTPLTEADFSIYFWKSPDGGFHADARRSIGVTLDPGRRWESDEPWMAVYGFGPGEPEGWRTVAAPDAAWKRFLEEGR